MEKVTKTIVTNGRVITPWKVFDPGTVIIEGDRIIAVSAGSISNWESGTIIDASGLSVVPGFVDIHVHGALDHDVMDATPEAIASMSRFLMRCGVTSYLPTTIASGFDETMAAITNVARCQQIAVEGACILGVHLEGPYVNPKFPGALPLRFIRSADPEEYAQLLSCRNVRLITLAPEISQNRALITYAKERGVAVAVGHSGASYEEVMLAVSLGLNQSCHTFNAMAGLHHRSLGTVGAVLACDDIFAQIIVDFVHVHPEIVKLLVRVKGRMRTVLITDAIRATGLPDGSYLLGEQSVTVRGNVARLTGQDTLAGSTLTMDRALGNVMTACNLSLEEALPMATAVPAASLFLEHEIGSIEPGHRADLTLLNKELTVQLTIVQGRVGYQATNLQLGRPQSPNVKTESL